MSRSLSPAHFLISETLVTSLRNAQKSFNPLKCKREEKKTTVMYSCFATQKVSENIRQGVH